MWNTATYAASLKPVAKESVYDARGWGFKAVVAAGKLFRALKGERVYVITAL